MTNELPDRDLDQPAATAAAYKPPRLTRQSDLAQVLAARPVAKGMSQAADDNPV